MKTQIETLKLFFQAFKISLKNALMYPHHHPGFQHSIQNLTQRLQEVSRFFSPLIIKISPTSLRVNDFSLEGDTLYQELACFLHLRKIKSLTFIPGIEPKELSQLITTLSLPLRDYYRQEGLMPLLASGAFPHIQIEELDYSQLLKGEGEEIKDVWGYLLDESIKKEDNQLFREVEESFVKFISSLDLEKLINDEEINLSLEKFFARLQEVNAPAYPLRVKEFLRSLLHRPNLGADFPLEKYKKILTQLSEEDLALFLSEELIHRDDFDSLRWQLITRIIPEEKNEKISALMKDILSQQASLLAQGKLQNKIKKILSSVDYPLAETYKSVLEELSTRPEVETLPFDSKELKRNFRFILLNLFHWEEKTAERQKITQLLGEEVSVALEEKDFEFIKYLYSSLQNLPPHLVGEAISQIKKIITKQVEQLILEGEKNLYFQELINLFDASYYNENVYLEIIFDKKIVTPYLLQAFLHFFSDHLFYFLLNLERVTHDEVLVENIITNLQTIDSPQIATILKHIFPLVSPSLQVKIIQAFQKLSLIEHSFLQPLIKHKNLALRKEAIRVLVQNPQSREKILQELLLVPSPFGLRNRFLRANIQIITEIGVPEAQPYLQELSQRKFFWNKKLREEAHQALERLTHGI
ncbi:MAG: hypothetical protein DRJ11_00205 [Candidatus Aminicenantes bacterium]|nr:MAG: hypothetical protein DRJ11_00205 [Candidatus Aminicenantes bacterium]